MKFLAGGLILACLPGCLAVSAGMADAERRDMTHEGIEYSVYFTRDRAQIDRVTPGGPVLQRRARAAMPVVIEQATGCAVVKESLAGDSNMSRADLRC